MQDDKQNMDDKSAFLIDSRTKDRYLSKTEPLYGRAGHIPGAKNYFWKDVLGAEGNWKDNEELERHFRSEEHTSELQSRGHLVCRLLLEKKNKKQSEYTTDKHDVRSSAFM